MTCTSCGTENRTGAKFCAECGASLAAVCPSCGAVLAPTAKFCSDCGQRIGAASGTSAVAGAGAGGPAPGEGGAAGAERRLVTVLFADLVGFTTLAEGRDAERVRELLSRYFETASEIVRRYGGTVEKFIGDAVMAVWGAPTAHEDDAERGVRAALDLVAAVEAVGRDEAVALVARAGVLTGEAAVTLGATNQGLVAGDLVNTASRLQSVAPPGAVLVGEATRQATEGSIAFEPAGEALLKGKSSPVPAFRALRVIAKARGVGRSDALEPPFVGREAEFRLVREAFHAVARDRRARLVSITGEAGIGKSRLAWEFSKYTDGLAEQMFWHEGRSPAYGEGVSFWALSEMVRKRCGLVEGDDDATTRERVAETVARHVADTTERAFVEPCLLALLGIGEPPPGGRERLFAGWRMFFERLAAEDPVVLLFEDIQWADDGLLDFVESLLEWSQSYPIFVVTLARPELLERRPTWGAGRNATSLPLGPLGDDAMRQLLAGLVPGLPLTAARSILERAGGIPLYAVETVRMLVGSGRLESAGDGTYRATGPLDVIDVPPSLQALIAARLDGLPPTERALLQDAAVLGQTFPVAALAAITGEPAEALEPRLRTLVALDLLAFDTDPRSPERGQYGFVQALIREVAYGTLAKRDRRTRHLAAARYFEALGDEELSGALATHYLAAYRAAAEGPEADALAAQARIALRAAAERAAGLGSPEQALAYFDLAAGLPGEDTERLGLLERAGVVAEASGRYERAQRLFREAAARWRELGDRPSTARATTGLGEALLATDLDRAEATLAAAIEEFGDLEEDSPELLALRYAMARVLLRRGHNVPAARLLHELMPRIERTGDLHFVLRALAARGATLPSLGQPIEGSIVLEGVLARAVEAGFVDLADRARINLSVTLADDDVRRGRDIAIEGLADAVRRGARGSAAFYAANASEYDLHLGDWEAGQRRVAEALELGLEATDLSLNLALAFTFAVLRGDPDAVMHPEIGRIRTTDEDALTWAALASGDGRAAMDHALVLARDDELNAPFAYLRAAVGAALAGDAAVAAACRDELAAQARRGRWVDATLEGIVAIAYALEGRDDDAVAIGHTALAHLREQGVVFDAALVALALGRALGGRHRDAHALLEEARATLSSLEARPLLEILDRAPAGSGRGIETATGSGALVARGTRPEPAAD